MIVTFSVTCFKYRFGDILRFQLSSIHIYMHVCMRVCVRVCVCMWGGGGGGGCMYVWMDCDDVESRV